MTATTENTEIPGTPTASPRTAKAVVAHGAGDIRVEDRTVPAPGPGEVLVRVAYAGICGSDLSYYRHGAVGNFVVREPMVLGHEVSGTVVAGGSFEPGTPVTIHPASPGQSLPSIAGRPNIWPGSAYLGSAATTPHQQGAMSGYTIAREDQIRVLPADLPLRRAALAEPLGVALHAIARSGGVEGKSVLISGAGPVGLLATAAAIELGATSVAVSDLLPEPLAIARTLGAQRTVQVGVGELEPESFDVVLECSGAPAGLSAAVSAAARGGVVVQVGILPGEARPVALADLISKEVDLRGSFRFDDEITDAVALLAGSDRFDAVVTDVFDIADAPAAFDRAADPRASAKVLVQCGDAAS
jgi:L-idonate 5-dehydrogenase